MLTLQGKFTTKLTYVLLSDFDQHPCPPDFSSACDDSSLSMMWSFFEYRNMPSWQPASGSDRGRILMTSPSFWPARTTEGAKWSGNFALILASLGRSFLKYLRFFLFFLDPPDLVLDDYIVQLGLPVPQDRTRLRPAGIGTIHFYYCYSWSQYLTVAVYRTRRSTKKCCNPVL